MFGYADRNSWILNGIAFVAAIGAGVPLPLMDLVFGKFTTLFVDFGRGSISPSEYRAEISKYTLYFVYLFIAKFILVGTHCSHHMPISSQLIVSLFQVYIHTVCISIAAIRTTRNLRVDIVKSLLRQEIAFFDSAESASPSVKVTTTANLVNQGISEKSANPTCP